MSKFTITKHHNPKSGYEQKALSSLYQQIYADDISGFINGFNYDLERMKRTNHVNPKWSFKMIRTNTREAELWHVNIITCKSDRKLATISEHII